MKCPKILMTLVLACASLAILVTPVHAAIDSMSLGASYNSSKTGITFRVYSSQATRMVLYLYSAGYGDYQHGLLRLPCLGGLPVRIGIG
jgi:glycogen operon protein